LDLGSSESAENTKIVILQKLKEGLKVLLKGILNLKTVKTFYNYYLDKLSKRPRSKLKILKSNTSSITEFR